MYHVMQVCGSLAFEYNSQVSKAVLVPSNFKQKNLQMDPSDGHEKQDSQRCREPDFLPKARLMDTVTVTELSLIHI